MTVRTPVRRGHGWYAALIALGAFGCVVALLSTLDHIGFKQAGASKPGFCSAIADSGCSAAHVSPAAEVLGVPISIYGGAFYIAVIVASALAWRAGRRPRLGAPPSFWTFAPAAISVAALGSVGYSAYLAHVLISQGEMCPFCATLYGVNAGLLLVAGIAGWPAIRHPLRNAKGILVAAAAMGVIGSAVIGAALPAYFASIEPQPGGQDMKPVSPEGHGLPLTTSFDLPARIPSKGSDKAAATLIEFSDFECPHCARMHESVSELSSRVGEQKLRVRFVNFPLDTACNCHVRVCLHKTACMAARASICAQGQGKFWEYAELAFANRNSHGREDVVRFAGDLGMDAVRFERCLDSAETAAALAEDIEIAASAGVTATPTTLVNGVKYEGALSFQDLMGILEHTAMCSCDLEVKGQPSCKM